MRFSIVTAPAAEPISTSNLKAHLNVDSSADDSLIASMAIAARVAIELHTGCVMINQVQKAYLSAFPDGNIELKRAPISSVALIRYRNTDGTYTTVDSADYGLEPFSGPPWPSIIYPIESWPSVELSGGYPVQVQFACGYGSSGSSVNAVLLQALYLTTAHLYENRESTFEVIRGQGLIELPLGIQWLLDPVIIR